jgi:hypothetical protein
MKKIEFDPMREIIISKSIAGAVSSGTGASWIPVDSLYATVNNAYTSFSKTEATKLRELCAEGCEVELENELRRLFGSKADRFSIEMRRL